MTVSRIVTFVALAFCFVAGYFLAGWWSSARDTNLLAQICARVDYVNGLQGISRADRTLQATKWAANSKRWSNSAARR